MDTWQQYTLRANTEFQLACYGSAILMHNQALDYARHNFSDRSGCCLEHAIARVLISNFNLADCYIALNEPKRAADCYLAAQKFLGDVQLSAASNENNSETILHAHAHLQALWCELMGKYSQQVPYAAQVSWYHARLELLAETDARQVRH